MKTILCRCGKPSNTRIYVGTDEGELQYCGSDKCRDEIITELHEFSKKYYQGKKSSQIKDSEKIAGISLIVVGLALLFEACKHIIK